MELAPLRCINRVKLKSSLVMKSISGTAKTALKISPVEGFNAKDLC